MRRAPQPAAAFSKISRITAASASLIRRSTWSRFGFLVATSGMVTSTLS
jgi:hypothetical protein